jgi:hypothetical protein
METFERNFRAHLARDISQDALNRAVEISLDSLACLLCFERDHAGCHRSIVVEAMVDREALDIRHLGVRHGLAKEWKSADDVVGSVYAIG